MVKLSKAQTVLLYSMKRGATIRQGNLELRTESGYLLRYDRRSLRVLINRNLLQVDPTCTYWEYRRGQQE